MTPSGGANARRHRRTPIDCLLSVTYKDPRGAAKSLSARGIDISDSGARIEAPEPIDPNVLIYLTVEEFGLLGSACVRHCQRVGSKYVIGLEFGSGRNRSSRERPEDFVDYYEVLQVSPTAERETILRVYRMLADRFPPESADPGDLENFLLLTRACDTLADPKKRADYDADYTQMQSKPIRLFDAKAFVCGIDGEMNRRLGMLCLLYIRRRLDPEDPGLSLPEFERLMSVPREHLLFASWLLEQKGCIRPHENDTYVITVAGADFLESSLPPDHMLCCLLRPRKMGASR